MKKYLSAVLSFAAVLVLVTVAFRVDNALAITSGPNGGPSQVSTMAAQFEGLAVAAGAQIQSAVLRTDFATECEIVADNSAGGSSRTLNVDWIGSDGTTIIYRQAVTVTNATRALVQVGAETTTASLPAGITVVPAPTGRRMQFTLAAAGAAAGSLAVYCR